MTSKLKNLDISAEKSDISLIYVKQPSSLAKENPILCKMNELVLDSISTNSDINSQCAVTRPRQLVLDDHNVCILKFGAYKLKFLGVFIPKSPLLRMLVISSFKLIYQLCTSHAQSFCRLLNTTLSETSYMP